MDSLRFTISMTHRGTRSLRMIVDTEDPLYPGLKKLKLQGRDLSALPPDLFQLTELQVLDISPEREACLYYKMTELPTGIGRLVNLKILLIDTNDLRALPAAIGNLKNLERMAASNNMLTSLPPEFSQLKSLRSLHLANNKFEQFPPELCSLENLEFLDLSDNLLISIPSNIKNLKQLQTLMLFENRLEILPDEVCDLAELRCLWLGNNNLRALPRNFGQLKQLDWTWHYTSTTLDGNPLIHPPLDVCKMGTDEVERYFSQQMPPPGNRIQLR